ncbi:hypothetical protein ACFLZZ_01730 [Nanoarchaeota archaeon]
MAMYEVLDSLKGRPGLVLAAFMVQIGVIILSLGKKKAVYNIEQKIENKQRIETALTNYGLK